MSQPKSAHESRVDLINAASRAEIDHWVAKYPPEEKRSAVMPALRIVQDQNGGWLTTELMDAVAEYLEMEPIAVYEVATFYSMYELKPVGKHKICVCTNVSCMLCGSNDVLAHLKQRLGIGLGETTADGRYTIKEVECLGACVDAPMFQIGRTYYGQLTPAKIDEILDNLD
ncbi:NADH-quinone oxidoreductase subunit NuoE [Ectothiorhodospiraceae bacterium 2226]|nr:NADH-quinone oxidoreductase subunit NuoE [Ectothiorhodospiraceae bacterium 2226]